MKHHQFFTKNKLLKDEIESIATHIQSEDIDDVLEHKYKEKVSLFLEQYPIDEAEETKSIKLLLFNYWYIILLYRKHHTWGESTFKPYFTASIRIVEFMIYICHTQNKNLMDIFVGIPYNTVLFTHFGKILDKIDMKRFSITRHNKKHNEVSLSQIDSYRSKIVLQPKGEDNNESDFSFYFKLKHELVIKIYDQQESQMNHSGSNPNRGHWKRTPFIDKEEYLEQLLPFDVKDRGKENTIEFETRKTKLSSFDLKDASLIFGESDEDKSPDIKKINFSSPYKRYLINKAIGQSITKQNLSLKSKYNIPGVEILFSLFNLMLKEDSLTSNLIFLTVIFGIRTEKLIFAISEFDSHIKLNKRDSKLKFDSLGKGKVFAAYEIDDDIAKNTNKKEVEVYLPQIIVRVWEETRRLISEKYNHMLKNVIDYGTEESASILTEILDKDVVISQKHQKVIEALKSFNIEEEKFLNLPPQMVIEIESESREFLKKHVDSFYKNITLKYQTLPLLFLHLFKTRKQESDIHLLFSGVMGKNDEARVCYASVPPRLLHYESWQLELIELLGLDVTMYEKYGIKTQRNSTPFVQTDHWVGSRLYIKGTYFQKFLLDLLSLRFENKIDQINARMIFLKYILSCLIGARDFTSSLSMEQFSKREKLLFIQEKGKNLFSSKRIIPLSLSGILLVEKFLQIRQEYDFKSFYPCFIEIDSCNNKNEAVMNRKKIVEWLKNKTTEDNEDIMINILRFAEHTPLNFGRHIFTSYATQSSMLKSQYIDAFLNHYKMGTEDQGGYSHFDNQEYFQQIRNVMHDIERIYIPKVWEKLW